jgi:hypothetical protein
MVFTSLSHVIDIYFLEEAVSDHDESRESGQEPAARLR